MLFFNASLSAVSHCRMQFRDGLPRLCGMEARLAEHMIVGLVASQFVLPQQPCRPLSSFDPAGRKYTRLPTKGRRAVKQCRCSWPPGGVSN